MKRIGFIGTGWTDMGQINAFRKSGLTAQAIFSRKASKAASISKKYGIPEVYTDWKKLIESPKTDLVSIVLPTFLHAEVIRYCRKFNKPFICEAPFLSVTEIKDLMGTGSSLEIIDYELRFTPHFIKMKNLIENNQIGKVVSFDFKYFNARARDPEMKWEWSHDLEKGGGYLNLVGGHFIDLAQFLFGKHEEVLTAEFSTYKTGMKDASGNFREVTADDEAVLQIRYGRDFVGNISISQMSREEKLCFTVKGEKGILRVENNELLLGQNNSFQPIPLDHKDDLFTGFDDNLFCDRKLLYG